MSEQADSVVRAITDDGAFRVITARTTHTVRGAVAAQHGSGTTARSFGDLLTAAILFRETMAPKLRVQSILKSARGRGSLIADSHPSGKTRGLIQLPDGARELNLDAGALLQVMRTMPDGHVSQGIVKVPAGSGIPEALMDYMQTSEQVVSMLALGTLMRGENVVSAGGYLVQLLPEVGRGSLTIMTERLRDFGRMDSLLDDDSFSPQWLLAQLLDGMPFTQLEESAVDFDCWCDELRLMTAMSTLSRADIELLLADGEVLEISCDYCGREYRIAPAQLRGLLEPS
jgi:molecular chaperone Hsp33